MTARTLNQLPNWPVALTRAEALEYSRLAPSLIDRIVTFRPLGPRGALVCSTEKLREATARILAGSAVEDDDEFGALRG